jgi:hypothetical protein
MGGEHLIRLTAPSPQGEGFLGYSAFHKERRRRSARKQVVQTSHQSVQSGDRRGGFDTLQLPPLA